MKGWYWYEYFDMHSGGYPQTEFEVIWIQARSQNEADDIFENTFECDPNNTTCECCGQDYVVFEYLKLDLNSTFSKQAKNRAVIAYGKNLISM